MHFSAYNAAFCKTNSVCVFVHLSVRDKSEHCENGGYYIEGAYIGSHHQAT